MADKLHLHLFGSPQFTYQDKPLTGIVSNKARALLIYLAVTSQPHSRDALAELLWADKAATRRDNLKKALNQLRNHAHIPLHEERQQTVALDLNRFWSDVVEFERLASSAAIDEVHTLQRAVELYRGDFLSGFNTSLSYEFEAWALGEQTRLKAEMTAVLRRLADGYTDRNEVPQAIATTRQLLQLEPWQEEAHHQLIELLALSGDRSAALVQFEQCWQILAAELDVEPSAPTIELMTKIRSGALDVGSDRPAYAIVRPTMAQVVSAPHHNLPAPTTPFIGREQEVADLARLLDNPDVRLVTILGTGGMGKTRLALEVVATKRDAYPHGVCFVALAPLAGPDTMVSAIAASVGYTFQTDDRSPKEQLLDYLRAREMLLLLDNAEHLLAGVSLFIEILQAAPNVRLLVTSRERLRLSSETVFALEGLALSESIYAGDERAIHEKPSAALQLFLQSAQRVRPSFSPTATDWAAMVELCRLVGGMPLGLILAASWIEVLAPVEIVLEINQNLDFLAADLHDLPDRHRSLRAIFNTTWQQLAAHERDVFRKLSVFRGGFTRAAAEAVAGASLATLTSLSHKSLIQVQPNRRYEIHELLRQFAMDALAEQFIETRDAHSIYYCTFLTQREVDLKGVGQQAAMAEVEADIENIRAAWQWAVENRKIEYLHEALECLGLFYLRQSWLYDGEATCRLALGTLAMTSLSPTGNEEEEGSDSKSNSHPALHESIQARFAVRVCIWLSVFQRHLTQAEQAQQRLRLAQEWLTSTALYGLDTQLEKGLLLLTEGESILQISSKKASDAADQSIAIFRALGNQWYLAQGLDLLGRAFQAMGLGERAKETTEESLAHYQNLGDARGIAGSLKHLSNIARWRGRFEEAGDLIRQSIKLFAELHDRGQQAHGNHTLGGILVFGGQFAESLQFFDECLCIYQTVGLPGASGIPTAVKGFALMHLGRYEEAQTHLQLALPLISKTETGYAVKDLGRISLAMGAYIEAQQHLTEALMHFRNKADMNGFGQALGCLGYLVLGQGNVPEAQEYICENLQLAADTRLFLPSMTALAGVALLHAAEGNHTAAVEIYTVALQNPHVANSRWFHDVVGQQIDAVAATLSPDVVATAQARGRAQDWRTSVQRLSAEWRDVR